ncbi:MAG: DUF4823 domain-containing protein [Gammaproteobacteria bacterium]|nr:DUF4823 domain-containing protein [Gammaproteobacteria bacterium]
MRQLLLMMLTLTLASCMQVGDLTVGAADQMRDVRLLNHSKIKRANNWRIQADSHIYISQGLFVPLGYASAQSNIVAQEAFNAFVEYFPFVQCASLAMGFDEALQAARSAGADYLLYTRFAQGNDRIGNLDEVKGVKDGARFGVDRSAIHLMLVEVGSGYLVDTVNIRNRGGLLSSYNNKPEDLIRPPLRDYARRLLGLNP